MNTIYKNYSIKMLMDSNTEIANFIHRILTFTNLVDGNCFAPV